MTRRLLVAVEGAGDQRAVENLITRLWKDLELPENFYPSARRFPGLETERGVERVAVWARAERDVGGLVLLRDADDECPADEGPEIARLLGTHRLPFPAAVVLIRREFESLFLASLGSISGRRLGSGATARPGVQSGSALDRRPEEVRGAKEWLSRHFPPGERYKPTVDQLDLSRLVDFEHVRRSGHDSFGVLERALRFVSGGAGPRVYPPPSPARRRSRPRR